MQPGLTLIDSNLPVQPILDELAANPDLWDEYPQRRKGKNSPHSQMTDIWLRFADINTYAPTNYGDMMKPHDSVWYEAIDKLPSVKAACNVLMGALQGERLGGVLISRLPPGGSIAPHTDHDWHAEYYKKFHILLQGEDTFIYSGNSYLQAKQGDLFHLDSSQIHGVINNGSIDRLALIVCVRQDEGNRVEKY